MKTTALLLASCAMLMSAGSAGAGQCTSEIDTVSKAFAARDAGSGPTAAPPGSPVGQYPPTAAMSEADPSGRASQAAEQSNKPQHPPTAIMNRETTGNSSPSTPSAPPAEHPPTATMNQETQGSAASPQDVQRQNEGQPTAAQRAQGQIASAHDMAGAMDAFERARLFDRQGSEAECLKAIGQAKLLLGTR